MFYILVSRIPFVYNINDKNEKFFRTFLLGSICYIIMHGLLYSKRFSNNIFIQRYKKYLLHLASADILFASSIIYFLDKKDKNNDNNDIEHQNESDNENSYVENISENKAIDDKMTREQIMQNFYNNPIMAQQQALLAQSQNGSPFINKTSAEEFKRKNLETVIENTDNTDNNDNDNDNKVNNINKELNSNKKNDNDNNNNNNIKEDLEISNSNNTQLKPSDKSKSLENLIEEQNDTDIPLYQPEE